MCSIQLDEFFAELGMTNTTYCKAEDDHDNMPKRAAGYYWKDGKLNRFNSEYYKLVQHSVNEPIHTMKSFVHIIISSVGFKYIY